MGAYLEFDNKVINTDNVKDSMEMPGGAPHHIAPGQITDDGELTLCLL